MARRTLGLVDWAAIAAASAMPLVVAAQTAEPEVYSLDGSVTVEQAVDDNIYGTANNRESDFVTRVMPRLEAKMETEALTARAIANAEYGRFASHDDEDYLDAEIGADATLRFVDGLSAFANMPGTTKTATAPTTCRASARPNTAASAAGPGSRPWSAPTPPGSASTSTSSISTTWTARPARSTTITATA